MLRFNLLKTVLTVILAWAPTAAAFGETLEDALSLAYRTNPTIRAERARLRAVRETKAQAWAGALPQITASASYSRVDDTQTTAPGIFAPVALTNTSKLDTITGGVTGEQPVFTGFRNFNAIKQAAARLRAGGAQLASVEQKVLSEVADAYFNVRLARAVYNLNRRNVEVLLRQQALATARFDVGEITRTDVAQADARVAAAQSALANAQSRLAVARAAYMRLVGRTPGDLAPVEHLPELPDNEESAHAIARQYSPLVITAREQSEVSRRQINIARSALLPSVSVVAGYQYAEEPSTFIENDEQFTYGARASMPLFLGGLNYSRVREARARHAIDRSRIIEAERRAAENVTAAWQRLLAARVSITSSRAGVDASQLALEGVKQEALLGARTTLDVLDAEQEALNAEVRLASAERDAQSAAFALLAAIGLLTPQAVGVDNGAHGEVHGERESASR